MKPTEIIGNCHLYLGDCREILPTLPKVDLVLTDPPYGISFKPRTRSTKSNDSYARGRFETGFSEIHGDNEEFNPSFLLGGQCVLWGANNFAKHLPTSNGWLVWYKAGGIKGFNMSECEMAWTNIVGSTKHIDHLWHGFKRASEYGERVVHPTQKPVAVMEWCINLAPKNTLTVADPFAGSGTTGVACANMGKTFYGIERESKYFSIMCKRIEQAYAQARLFA